MIARRFSITIMAFSLSFVFIAAAGVAVALEASRDVSPKPAVDAFFAKMKADFDKSASSSVLFSRKTSAVNAHFFKMLKQYQFFHALIKTDAKGNTVSEVIRIEGPAKEKRDLSNQSWFRAMSSNCKEYTGFIKEDNGRFHLFWARPLLAKSRAGKETFTGAVAVKVDIWDCFQKISKNMETPFLIKIDRLTLYSHKWGKKMSALQEPLSVPGLAKISIRYQSSSTQAIVEPDEATLQRENEKAALEQTAREASQAKAAKDLVVKKRTRIIVTISSIIVFILIIIVIRLIIEERKKAMIRRMGG